jgi:hypothetical protein
MLAGVKGSSDMNSQTTRRADSRSGRERTPFYDERKRKAIRSAGSPAGPLQAQGDKGLICIRLLKET